MVNKICLVWMIPVLLVIFNCVKTSDVAKIVDSITPVYEDDDTKLNVVIRNSHKGSISAISISPDGKYIVTGSFDNTLKLWDNSGRLIKNYKRFPQSVSTLAFSPDSRYIAAGSMETINLLEIEGKHLLSYKAHEGFISSIVFSPDGTKLISGSWDKTIKIWDLKGALLNTLKGHTAMISEIAINSTSIVASASYDGTIRFWDPEAAEEIRTIKAPYKRLRSIAFHPVNGFLLVGSTEGSILQLDPSGQKLTEFGRHENSVCDIAFDIEGTYMVSASQEGVMNIWSPGGELLKSFQSNAGFCEKVAAGTDIIASGSNDKTLKLWDLNGNSIKKVEDYSTSVSTATISSDGKSLLCSSPEDGLYSWDIDKENKITYPVPNAGYFRFAVSRDGKYQAAVYPDWKVKVWDSEGVLQKTFTSRLADFNGRIMFSPNGDYLYILSMKYGVEFWKMDGSKTLLFKNRPGLNEGIIFSPPGESFLSARNNELMEWNPEGDLIRKYSGHSQRVTVARFSPGGDIIISGSIDKSIIIWKSGGTPVKIIKEYNSAISRLEFSSDGRYFLSKANGAEVILWNIKGEPVCRFDAAYNLPARNAVFAAEGTIILLKHPAGFAFFTTGGKLVKDFSDPQYDIMSFSYSGDGKYLTTGLSDGTIKIRAMGSWKSISLLSFKDERWFVYNDRGEFDCMPEDKGSVFFSRGLELYGTGEAGAGIYKPGLLEDYFSGTDY